MKDIASRETEGRVHIDDLEKYFFDAYCSQWKEEKCLPKTGSIADEERFSRFLHGTLREVRMHGK